MKLHSSTSSADKLREATSSKNCWNAESVLLAFSQALAEAVPLTEWLLERGLIKLRDPDGASSVKVPLGLLLRCRIR